MTMKWRTSNIDPVSHSLGLRFADEVTLDCRCLFIDVFHENTNKIITIGNIYRPPRNYNSNPTIKKCIQQINPIISKQSKENSHAIFTGNFNINLLEINTRIKYQAYFDQFVNDGFYPKIVQPCRFTKRTGSNSTPSALTLRHFRWHRGVPNTNYDIEINAICSVSLRF